MFVQDGIPSGTDGWKNDGGDILAQSRIEELNISSLLGMPAEIPARSITLVRKQRVDARLRLRRIEQIFRLTILLPHSVVGLHRN